MRFKGTVEGTGAAVSRSGSERSGIIVKADGNLSGVAVVGWVNKKGRDVFEVTMTTGRSPAGRRKILGYIELKEDGAVEWTQYESERIIKAR